MLNSSLLPSPDLFSPAEVLPALLHVSLTGVILFRPVLGPDGSEIVDLAYVYLNPAAQRMLNLPEQPASTFLQLYPNAVDAGIFAFYAEAFRTGQPGHYNVNYQHDKLDNYFQLAALRSGSLLVVNFSDTSEQDRSSVEQALRESQYRERVALAEAEAQRQQLASIFMQAPACIAQLVGPEHRFEMANPLYQALFGGRELVGKNVREALPELADQPFFGLMDRVYRTGQTHFGNEVPAYLDRTNSGRLEQVYFNFIYQATHDGTGASTGVIIYAYDVTEQVLARHKLELSEQTLAVTNEELAAANEELHAINDELMSSNNRLMLAEQALLQLNQQLEERVEERTAQLQKATQMAERQRETFYQVFEQAPAYICLLRGPEHRYEYHNTIYQQLHAGRQLLGHTVREVQPEAEEQGFVALFDKVYHQGETYRGEEVPYSQTGPDGTITATYFDFTCQPFRENGATVGVCVFAFDVTEQVLTRRQTAEQEVRQRELLQDQQSQLQQILGQVPASLATLTGPEHRFTFFNDNYNELVGGRAQLGRSVAEALPEMAEQGFVDLLDRVFTSGEPFLGVEAPVKLQNAGPDTPELRYVDFVYQPLFDARGQTHSILAFVMDSTEKVLARQQLEELSRQLVATNATLQQANADAHTANQALTQSNQQLRRTNQDLDNFVYAASHDLKQPVNNLSGLFEELRRAVTFADPAEEQTLMPLINDSIRQLSTSIEDLAALGQTQQEAHHEAETVNLAELTQDVLQTLQPQMIAVRARVTTDFSARPELHFSRPNLRTILLNLVGNALKYADPTRAARIHVSMWVAEDGNPVLRVDDNGLGIDTARHGDELFQLFRRFHAAHTDGTGVGLYLVNRIVQANGGHIEVESEVGQGTTFRVFLRE